MQANLRKQVGDSQRAVCILAEGISDGPIKQRLWNIANHILEVKPCPDTARGALHTVWSELSNLCKGKNIIDCMGDVPDDCDLIQIVS